MLLLDNIRIIVIISISIGFRYY